MRHSPTSLTLDKERELTYCTDDRNNWLEVCKSNDNTIRRLSNRGIIKGSVVAS